MRHLSLLAIAAALTLAPLTVAIVPLCHAAESGADPSALDTAEFTEKLREMLDRTEKSVKLVREQIVQSQTAPFLPELYMQLADLLSQKSNTLYYIQMERTKDKAVPEKGDQSFSPVVQAQQEAIGVYRRVLKDFPAFAKRKQAQFRLAVALKSIDEIPEFIRVGNEVVQQHPGSEEAMRTRILLGQHFFEKGEMAISRRMLAPVMSVSFVYERNLARYRVGLIEIAEDRFRDALSLFEKVISDPDLKEQDNPYEISLKERRVKSDLRREALIDSIRAYTHVYAQNPNPVGYYSKLSPTESLFQEVIEKLALRYINLKKYDQAVLLLRTLSERTADPQKVVNIYQEVFLMIPPADRVQIPVSEVKFILDRYNQWISYFAIPKATLSQAHSFLEKQVRDFGTRAHDLAKSERTPETRAKRLKRAREFYHMYLGFFDKGPASVKMATNLADVYFAEGNFLDSGEYYLRTFQGDFGKPAPGESRHLIENAILCLNKQGDRGYYENVRKRGLLIKAMDLYGKSVPGKQNDPRVSFAALKAEYEQGFFPEVLEKLYAHMRRFPASPEAVKAGELILDYFNTRSEFGGLELWADKILAAHIKNPAFNARVAGIKKQAKSKAIQEKVKSVAGYDDFAQGKSYLAAALATDNTELADEVLKQALAKSKRERDIETFLEAGTLMADKEKDPARKSSILRSVAREYLRVTRYVDGLDVLKKVSSDARMPTRERAQALEEWMAGVLVLRDWDRLEQGLRDPLSASLSPGTRSRIRDQIGDLINSGIEVSPALVSGMFQIGVGEDSLLGLYKAQYRLNSQQQALVNREVRARCGRESRSAICGWNRAEAADRSISEFESFLSRQGVAVQNVEGSAQRFVGVTSLLQSMEGSGDPALEISTALRQNRSYEIFARYLNRVAANSAELRPVLDQKAQETRASAKLYMDRCQAVPGYNRYCVPGRIPSQRELFQSASRPSVDGPSSDPKSGAIEELQKKIFATREDAGSLLALARSYYTENRIHHAAAVASLGSASFKQNASDFKAILGCSVLKLGLRGEALYHLKSASALDGIRDRCMAEAKRGGAR